MMSGGPHIDNLSTRNLRSPMLNEYMGSAAQKEDVGSVAREVLRRYLAKLSKHNDTGRLASTAKVTYHRVPGHADKRWEAEFSVGGGRVDYADDLEREYHLLSSVLREMGYNKGDGGGGGPTGKVAPSSAAPRRDPRPDAPLSQKDRWAMKDAALRREISLDEHNSRLRADLQLQGGAEARQAALDDLADRNERFTRSGRKRVSATRDAEYRQLVNKALQVQAVEGQHDAVKDTFRNLTMYRNLREAAGERPHPLNNEGSFEREEEEAASRGEVTFTQRRLGFLAPEDIGEGD